MAPPKNNKPIWEQCTVVSPDDIRNISVSELTEKASQSQGTCIEVKNDSDSVTLDKFGESTLYDFHNGYNYFKCANSGTTEQCLKDHFQSRDWPVIEDEDEGSRDHDACTLPGQEAVFCSMFKWDCTNMIPVSEAVYCENASWYCKNNKPIKNLSRAKCNDILTS